MSAPIVERLGPGRYKVECRRTCGGADFHVVTIAPDIAHCDCPAGVFRRPCRHIAAVTKYLVLAPLELATAAGPGLERDVPPPADT